MPPAMNKEARIALRARIRQLHSRGLSVDAVAGRCGVTTATVYVALMRPEMTRLEMAAARRALWVARRQAGLSVAEIARLSRVTERAVRQGLQKADELAAGDAD